MKYCSKCAHETVREIPEGEDRERDVCPACKEIFYVNPKVIVGCIPTIGDKVLLCKRAIEPRYGKWTLPAGFMENRETTEEGAARETWEEAEARAVNMALYRIFDVPHISQVYVSLVRAQRAWRASFTPRMKFRGTSSPSPSLLRCLESFLKTVKHRNFQSETAQFVTRKGGRADRL